MRNRVANLIALEHISSEFLAIGVSRGRLLGRARVCWVLLLRGPIYIIIFLGICQHPYVRLPLFLRRLNTLRWRVWVPHIDLVVSGKFVSHACNSPRLLRRRDHLLGIYLELLTGFNIIIGAPLCTHNRLRLPGSNLPRSEPCRRFLRGVDILRRSFLLLLLNHNIVGLSGFLLYVCRPVTSLTWGARLLFLLK